MSAYDKPTTWMKFISFSTNASSIDERYEDLLKMHCEEQDFNNIFQLLGSSPTSATHVRIVLG